MKDSIHILLPTDFSDESEYAIKAAKVIASKHRVTFSMTHIMPVNSVSHIGAESIYTDTTSMHSAIMVEMQDQARSMMLKQSSRNGIALYKSQVLIGPISTTIVEYAEEIDADLILLGSKKQKSIVSWFGGSDNQVVARQSSIPVLSVTKNHHNLDLNNILYIHNLHKHPLTAPHPLLLMIRDIFDAKLSILYINSRKGKEVEAQEEMEEYVTNHHLDDTNPILLNDENVRDALDDFKLDKYDLVALGTHGRGIISQLFQQSIAEHFIDKADKAILTFRIS